MQVSDLYSAAPETLGGGGVKEGSHYATNVDAAMGVHPLHITMPMSMRYICLAALSLDRHMWHNQGVILIHQN